MTEIGRTGEKLSFEHEWKRTGLKPIWQAVESNLSGFDILSVTNPASNTKLQIEVKATTSDINYASVHITRNEWQTAESSKNYIFHLWCLGANNRLYEIDVEEMSKHIPKDSGAGNWEGVEIPFRVLVLENRKSRDTTDGRGISASL